VITHAFADEGDYQMRLTVKDDNGDTDQATMTVQVHNVIPTATIKPLPDITLNEGDIITLDGTLSTDTPSDLLTLNYSWDFNAFDGSTEDGDAFGPIVDFAIEDDGDYKITLTVTDNNDAQSTAEIYFGAYNVPPSVRIGYKNGEDELQYDELTVNEDELIIFNATIQDVPADMPILNVSWKFGDGDGAYGREVYHSYAMARSHPYVVTIIVIDDGSESVEARLNVTVNNVPPQVDLGDDIHLRGKGTIKFEPMVEDTPSDFVKLTYDWNFGDGTTATEPCPTHVYTQDGTYKVTLTVTDDDDATATASIRVTVTGLPKEGADADNDNMADSWESKHGLDPLDPSDAYDDPDDDGYTNLQEHQGGTDPTDPLNYPIAADDEDADTAVTDEYKRRGILGFGPLMDYAILIIVVVGIVVAIVMFIRRKIADARLARAFKLTEEEKAQRDALMYDTGGAEGTTIPDYQAAQRFDYISEELSKSEDQPFAQVVPEQQYQAPMYVAQPPVTTRPYESQLPMYTGVQYQEFQQYQEYPLSSPYAEPAAQSIYTTPYRAVPTTVQDQLYTLDTQRYQPHQQYPGLQESYMQEQYCGSGDRSDSCGDWYRYRRQ
jgi:hypothetical protein